MWSVPADKARHLLTLPVANFWPTWPRSASSMPPDAPDPRPAQLVLELSQASRWCCPVWPWRAMPPTPCTRWRARG